MPSQMYSPPKEAVLKASVSSRLFLHELLSLSTHSRHGKIIQTKKETEWQTSA
jgi:hypothetical protein